MVSLYLGGLLQQYKSRKIEVVAGACHMGACHMADQQPYPAWDNKKLKTLCLSCTQMDIRQKSNMRRGTRGGTYSSWKDESMEIEIKLAPFIVIKIKIKIFEQKV